MSTLRDVMDLLRPQETPLTEAVKNLRIGQTVSIDEAVFTVQARPNEWNEVLLRRKFPGGIEYQGDVARWYCLSRITAVEDGPGIRKIEAIKVLKNALGIGLKEAKDLVEDNLSLESLAEMIRRQGPQIALKGELDSMKRIEALEKQMERLMNEADPSDTLRHVQNRLDGQVTRISDLENHVSDLEYRMPVPQ